MGRLSLVLLASLVVAGSSFAASTDSTVVAIIPVHARGPCAGVYGFGKLWVTDYTSGAVSTIDPRTNRLVGRNIAIGGKPCGIVAGAGSLWINGFGTNSVDRVSPTKRKLVKRIPVGARPYDVAYGYGAVWTTNNGSGSVSRIDPRTNRVVKVIPIAGSPTGLSATGGAVWVGTNSTTSVFRIDPSTNAAQRIDVGCRFPAWFAANQTELWVACNSDNLVLHLNAKSGKVLTTVKVSGVPQDGTIAPDGSVWVPNMNAATVTRIDSATATVTATLRVGKSPFVLNSGAGDIWSPSWGGNDVRRIHTG